MDNIPKQFENRLYLDAKDIGVLIPLSGNEIRKMMRGGTWGTVQKFGRRLTVKSEGFWAWQRKLENGP